MRISRRFIDALEGEGTLSRVATLKVELQGSLALTGIGHATDKATVFGLLGFIPEETDPDVASAAFDQVCKTGRLTLAGGPEIPFDIKQDMDLRGDIIPALHPNGMRLKAYDVDGHILLSETYYSVGGGFIATAQQLNSPAKDDMIDMPTRGPFQFGSASELINLCAQHGQEIHSLVLQNEDARRSRTDTEAGLDRIWQAMNSCIDRGVRTTGVLPGGLEVRRRAPDLYSKLIEAPFANEREQLFDWLNVYAMAVNEENAAGGRVVTAPTNGAAGIIPAVIRHYGVDQGAGVDDESVKEGIRKFLLTAGAVGILYKQRASISGAEMGCQGEVGVACSMAAAGLAALWGGAPIQIERAAEIGMEHNLGLTCDPVGGLVQIPCIERNAIGAVKAVNAARLALRCSEDSKVSLDQVIETMRQTGMDMSSKYKETSEGGLAVNVVEC